MTSTVLVLGGTGRVGRVLAGLLAVRVRVVVAGRHLARADAVARAVGASARRVEVTDPADLREALDGVDLAVVATHHAHAEAVARGCADAGCAYLDLFWPDDLPERLGAVGGGRLVTGAGVHPGLPGVLVRAAAGGLDRCDRARVGMAMTLRDAATAVELEEMVDLIAVARATRFADGAWRDASFTRDGRRIDYPRGFGTRWSVPLDVPELHALPAALGLEELAGYAASGPVCVDWVVLPLAIALYAMRPGLGRAAVARAMWWAYRRERGPQRGSALVAEAEGTRGGRRAAVRVSVAHDDVYFLTAAPAAAAALQIVEGIVEVGEGVHYAAHVVDPDAMLADLAAMGVAVERTGTIEEGYPPIGTTSASR